MSKIEKNRTYYDPYNEIRCDKFALEKFVKESEEKDKTIADLEAKLAEKEQNIEEINKEFVQAIKDWKSLVEQKEKEIEDMKIDLEAKDFNINTLMEQRKRKQKFYNQDKISFAVEQLEKVKEMVKPYLRFDWNLYLQVCENIDNQIKQLKEGK